MRQFWFFAPLILSYVLVSLSPAQTSSACPLPAAQRYTLLQTFGTNGQGPNDPQFSGIIAQGRDGNMFSTTPDTWTGGEGTVFKITSSGAVTTLHSFSGTDGAESVSGLTLATGGHYWGTTARGGLLWLWDDLRDDLWRCADYSSRFYGRSRRRLSWGATD